jgi:hypothetical protein
MHKLATQENFLKRLSGKAKNHKKRVNYRERDENLKRIKHKTVKTMTLIYL